MIDLSEFESIRPYSDEEAVAALARVARHPMIPVISKYLFPNAPINALHKSLTSVKSIDEFQKTSRSWKANAFLPYPTTVT